MIIIGLGNPGKKYQNNRHNVGNMFIDYLNKLSDQKKQKLQS
jgi:peptidyl-tRNA hydrolase